MNKLPLILWLFFILFLQIVVFNNINFLGYINPYIYISIVFLIPLKLNRFLFLGLAFLYGITIDSFTDTGGIHAFSILFIAYFRDFFIKLFFKKSEIDFTFFNLRSEPFGTVFNYVVILTLIHHFILFSLANFSFENLGDVLLRTVTSSVFTLILYFLGSYMFTKKRAS